MGSKNAILLHDIEIGKLFGFDFEKIKSIAQAETKIHSSTVTLLPLHLLFTRYASSRTLSLSLSLFPNFDSCEFFSNKRLHTHRVMVTAPAVLARSLPLSTVPRYFQSQVKLTG